MAGHDASRLPPPPVRPRPRRDETVGSYLRRLATANHLRFSYIRRYLSMPQGSYGQLGTAQAQEAVGGAYADAVEPVVLRDLLAGQRLMIITEPGAPPLVVTAISNAMGYADGTVTGQIALRPEFFDATGPALDSLKQVNMAMAQASHITPDSSKTYQQQAAHLLASECLTKSPGSPAVGPRGPGGEEVSGGDAFGPTVRGPAAR